MPRHPIFKPNNFKKLTIIVLIFFAVLFIGAYFATRVLADQTTKTFEFLANAEGFEARGGTFSELSWAKNKGEPRGSLRTEISGKNRHEINYWEWTGTWQELGAPAGSLATGIRLNSGYTKCGKYVMAEPSEAGPYELRDSEGNLLATLWSGRVLTDKDSDWTAIGQQEDKPVPAGLQPSNTIIKLRLNNTLATGDSASGKISLYDDRISFAITYSPSADSGLSPLELDTLRKYQQSPEISDNYELKKLKLIQPNVGRNDVRVEIGEYDELVPDLYLSRWEEEVKIKLKPDLNGAAPENISLNFEGGQIKFSSPKEDHIFYDLPPGEEYPEGGLEYEIVWKEKPEINAVNLLMETENLDFFFQPPLSQEEHSQPDIAWCSETQCFNEKKKAVIERPENVVGSYAVYFKDGKAGDFSLGGGKNYRAGKAFHIYRPKIVDATGNWVWGDLSISVEGKNLAINVPYDFWQNAVYPLTIDPAFGYETPGLSSGAVAIDTLWGSLFTSPADAGTADSLSFYANETGPGATAAKGVLVQHSSLTIVTNGVGNAVTISASPTFAWATSTFTTAPNLSASTEYVLMLTAQKSSVNLAYDTGSANQAHKDASNSYAAPIDPTDATDTTNEKFSIYCTYTAVAAGTCNPPTSGSIWNVKLSDNCYITSYKQFAGELNCWGSGRFTVASGGTLAVQKMNCSKANVAGTGKIIVKQNPGQ